MKAGFILLYRQITDWEWYQNPNTFRVFLHCLLMANFADGRYEGKEIKRGQFVTTLPMLAKQTSLSIQNVRTALEHLVSTGELTDSATRKYRIITVVNYDLYQKVTDRLTDNQQTTNRQIDEKSTDNQQTKTVVAVGIAENTEELLTDDQQTDQQQYNNNNNNYKVVVEEGFAPTDAEIAKSIERDSRIVDAARDVGLQVSTRAMINARDLADKYGLDNLIEAIGASVDVPKWSYVEGILRKGGVKRDGHTDDLGKHENPYSFLHNSENTI